MREEAADGIRRRDRARTHCAHPAEPGPCPNDTPHPLRRHFVLSFSVLMGASLIMTMSTFVSRGACRYSQKSR